MYRNVFFFHTINTIGGVETMFWELAKKYHKKFDITIVYLNGDAEQIKRLKKFVRVVKFKNEPIECEKAFFNYQTEPFISHLTAKHIYQIVHADFELQKNIKPNIDPRVNSYIAVSRRVAQAFYNVTGIECEVCANPLTLEPIKNPPLWLCCAQRLTAEKGGKRIKELISALDKDSEIKYYMTIFSNAREDVNSPNVAFMPSRLDIRPYIYGCDIFVAVSDSEGRCYSVGEKLGYGTGKLLLTPCPSFFEQGANEDNAIILNFDLSNMDEVVEEIRKVYRSKKIRRTFEPTMPEDEWDKFLVAGKPTYKGDKAYLVRTTDIYAKDNVFDKRLGCIPKAGVEYVEDDADRLNTLLNWAKGALVEVVKEVYGKA
jgi:hypothetical protein